MRSEPNYSIEVYRRCHPTLGSGFPGTNIGFFVIKGLAVISSGKADGWEHVSVSKSGACPTWSEMKMIKELFWDDTETVVQYHPKKTKYKNLHGFCLHLWKKVDCEWELPPDYMI